MNSPPTGSDNALRLKNEAGRSMGSAPEKRQLGKVFGLGAKTAIDLVEAAVSLHRCRVPSSAPPGCHRHSPRRAPAAGRLPVVPRLRPDGRPPVALASQGRFDGLTPVRSVPSLLQSPQHLAKLGGDKRAGSRP